MTDGLAGSDRLLFELAVSAMGKAHAPYSGIRVGAAVLDEKGNMHSGCNVENAALPNGWCAETTAIGAMIVSGGTRIETILVVSTLENPISPCGGCRQRISEFSSPETRVIMCGPGGENKTLKIAEILPEAFSEKFGK